MVTIVAAAEEAWARRFAGQSALVVNPRPELGMFSSIQLGVAASAGCSGLLIVPVDHPFVAVSTYLLLAQAFLQNPDAIIKPACDGRSGHPIIIPHGSFTNRVAVGAACRFLARGIA